MGSLILIVPILAFTIWLLATTGKRVFLKTRNDGKWTRVLIPFVLGIALGWFFAYRVEYKIASTLRLHSFPVPTIFIYQQDAKWVDSPLPDAMRTVVAATDFIFAIALAFFPFKIAEFVRQVKTEL
jgi:hypothetical protein